MAFTGQLLRWNQDAYWAVVVGAEQAARVPLIGDFLARILVAGQTVGGATLTRFYATHVFLIPAVMFVLIGLHLTWWSTTASRSRRRRAIVVDPKTYRQRYHALLHKVGVPFWPDAAWKDVVFALAVGAIVLALAIWLGPPELGTLADPTNPAGRSAPGLVLPVVLRAAGADAAGHRRLVDRRVPAAARPDAAAAAVRGAVRRAQLPRRPWAVGDRGVRGGRRLGR